MKLHPVTQLLLFAVALRLATDDVVLLWFGQLLGSPGLASGYAALKVRGVSAQMVELSQTLIFLGGAVWVEILSRWANQLKTARWRRSRASQAAS